MEDRIEQKLNSIIKDNFKISTNNILKQAYKALTPKEREVVEKRYGLRLNKKKTLKNIGDKYGLTRERIRQIENVAIKKMRDVEYDEDFYSFKNAVFHFLDEHGGFLKRDYLFFLLNKISDDNDGIDNDIRENHFSFLFSKFFIDNVKEHAKSDTFHDYYKLTTHKMDHFEEIAEEVLSKIKKTREILKIEELLDVVFKLKSYQKHKNKMPSEYYLSDRSFIYKDHIVDDVDLINKNKSLYSLLQIIKEINFNSFGHWGFYKRNDIRPVTTNDKIYLVLKNKGKVMHFTEITKAINEDGFNNKGKANQGTVHNELISDKRYILAGRGLYGLSEWGLRKGTVSDLIEDYLRIAEGPISKKEIVDNVLKERKIKIGTINLALSNRDKFKKTSDGYKLV